MLSRTIAKMIRRRRLIDATAILGLGLSGAAFVAAASAAAGSVPTAGDCAAAPPCCAECSTCSLPSTSAVFSLDLKPNNRRRRAMVVRCARKRLITNVTVPTSRLISSKSALAMCGSMRERAASTSAMATSATSGRCALRFFDLPVFAVRSISRLRSHEPKSQWLCCVAVAAATGVIARQGGAARVAVGSPLISSTCSSCAKSACTAPSQRLGQ